MKFVPAGIGILGGRIPGHSPGGIISPAPKIFARPTTLGPTVRSRRLSRSSTDPFLRSACRRVEPISVFRMELLSVPQSLSGRSIQQVRILSRVGPSGPSNSPEHNKKVDIFRTYASCWNSLRSNLRVAHRVGSSLAQERNGGFHNQLPGTGQGRGVCHFITAACRRDACWNVDRFDTV